MNVQSSHCGVGSGGDQVLVTQGIALEGPAILAQDFTDAARGLGLSGHDLAEERHLMAEVSVVPKALAVAAQGVTAMYDVTRGELLETLLEIAHLSGVGVEIDISRLPHRSVVSGSAQAFQFDPLRMISSRTLALTIPPQRVDDVSQASKEVGTPIRLRGPGHGRSGRARSS